MSSVWVSVFFLHSRPLFRCVQATTTRMSLYIFRTILVHIVVVFLALLCNHLVYWNEVPIDTSFLIYLRSAEAKVLAPHSFFFHSVVFHKHKHFIHSLKWRREKTIFSSSIKKLCLMLMLYHHRNHVLIVERWIEIGKYDGWWWST